MNFFPLPIFPEGSLSSSVVTTVWVGVIVFSLFNLRLGWALSGLVVPGYLVPLLIIKPWAAGVVIAEGFLTYFAVYGICKALPRFNLACALFGRDRFFAMILVSIALRLLCDGWLLPAAGAALEANYGIDFDYRDNLHSFGLIIICLLANQLWKTGALRGVLPFLVITGVTFLVVRFALMPLTNFNISSLGFLYEDVASSIDASPKAYIILVTTAIIASRLNLLYGWDFNGIIIPALIALQWYQPGKVLSSFVEALVILCVAVLALRLPIFKSITIEGGRKMLLFFNISFAYKMALSYALLWFFPDAKTSDYYGFGYLLPTLIAIKMHQRGSILGQVRITTQVSLVAVVASNLIGFGLTGFSKHFGTAYTRAPAESAPAVRPAGDNLAQILQNDLVGAFETRAAGAVAVPLPGELDAFANGVEWLARHLESRDEDSLTRARTHLARAGYRIDSVADRYLCLREDAPCAKGWGAYVFDTEAATALTIEVPYPVEEAGALESGLWLFEKMRAGALAVGGSARDAARDQGADVLLNPHTIFDTFDRKAAAGGVVQVRVSTGAASPFPVKPVSRVFVKSRLPEGLDLAAIETVLGKESFLVQWDQPALPAIQRTRRASRFAEIFLDPAHAVTMTNAVAPVPAPAAVTGRPATAWLLETFAGPDTDAIAPRGSERYRPPTLGDLLYLDDRVLTPLVRLAKDPLREADLDRALRSLNRRARVLGYELTLFSGAGAPFAVVLHESGVDPAHRGALALRFGPDPEPFVFAVPKPGLELGALEFACAAFDRAHARALFFATAHPQANADGSADVALNENQASVFTLFNQVLLREFAATPLLALQCRGFAPRETQSWPDADALLARSEPGVPSPAANRLRALLERDFIRLADVTGQKATAGYELPANPQLKYLAAAPGHEVAALWLSPFLRDAARPQFDDAPQADHFTALGIETRTDSLVDYLADHSRHSPAPALAPAMRDTANAYLATRDIVRLAALADSIGPGQMTHLVDADSGRAFLVFHDTGDGPVRAVANLNPRLPLRALPVDFTRPDADTVRRFAASHAAWLQPQEEGDTP